MSEKELARRTGLSVAKVRACEQGRRIIRVSLLEALVEALDIPADYFLNDLGIPDEDEERP
ncbi:MAG TPA: helix-turn-helix transcriptional regulator [Dongiaceae bacterium]|nr:helix-turn-helix transcriptional regulator [Dongiaceae bacterium]